MKRLLYIMVIFMLLVPLNGIILAQDFNAVTNSSCRLYADIGNTSSVVMYLKKGTPVSVEEKYDDYYFIKIDSSGGFVIASKIDLKEEADFVDYNQIAAENQARAEADQQAPVDRLSMLVGKYGEQTGRALYAFKIWKGINNNMVRDSWGKPARVNRRIEYDTVTEEWVYPKANLFFRDGILVGWTK